MLFLSLAPDFVGLAQANIAIPPGLAAGDYPLIVQLAGAKSNVATVTVR